MYLLLYVLIFQGNKISLKDVNNVLYYILYIPLLYHLLFYIMLVKQHINHFYLYNQKLQLHNISHLLKHVQQLYIPNIHFSHIIYLKIQLLNILIMVQYHITHVYFIYLLYNKYHYSYNEYFYIIHIYSMKNQIFNIHYYYIQ